MRWKTVCLMIVIFILTFVNLRYSPLRMEKLNTTNRLVNTDSNQEKLVTVDNEIVKYSDLNGDGIEDKIILTIKSSDRYEYSLQINEVKIDTFGSNIEPNFNIVDIDIKDNYKEIAVSEYGPSNDDATTFYYYNGKDIVPMGRIEGFYGIAYDYGSEVGKTKIDGSGKIITQTRGVVLQTWFYEDEYELSDKHLLINKPKDLYEMNTEVEVIKEITLQKSRSDSSEGITLRPGEKAVLVASDNKEWCMVRNSKGEVGWFAIDGFHEIRGLGVNASEVFLGLVYAD